MLTFLFALVIAYLVGSLSSAIIICKLMQLPDPRSEGSGNPGATNVLRIGGKKAAAITLVGDAFKGFFPVVLAHGIGVGPIGLGMVAIAAVIGHMFPIFFEFKGGKGVATGLGAIFGLSFLLGISALVIWGAMAYLFGYSSLAALTSFVAMPILCLLFGLLNYFFPLLLMTGLIAWRHKGNIDRLRKGTEPKIKK